MENIAHRTIIQNHNLTEIRFDLRQILDVGTISQRAMLPIVPPGEILAFALQPINDRIRIFLHRRREHNEIIPFADLPQKLVAKGSFMDVVEDWYLRTQDHAVGVYVVGELDFDHVACAHATAFGHAVD